MAIEGEAIASYIGITTRETVVIVRTTCSSAAACSILITPNSIDIAIGVDNLLLVIGRARVA